MTIHPFGDSALLLNFEQQIEEGIHAKVMATAEAIKQSRWPELTFLTPSYCSLTVGFDPKKISSSAFQEKIELLDIGNNSPFSNTNNKVIEVPVHYGGTVGPDITEVEEFTGLTTDEIIALHTSVEYKVYMIGFLPGFPYMGRLPKKLHCPRKAKPRLRVPAQSVGLAGMQTGIYPSEAPGGWQIIGRTPLKIFEGSQGNPFYFKAGDTVKFYAI